MENKLQNKKFERTTQEQLQCYLHFCKQHPEIQAGKNSPSAPHCVQELWGQLAARLNASRGPTRTAAKWKESLTHWKKQLRCRGRKSKFEQMRTGGGPKVDDVSEFEQQALQTLGASAVEGAAGVIALGVQNASDAASRVNAASSSANAATSSGRFVSSDDVLFCESFIPVELCDVDEDLVPSASHNSAQILLSDESTSSPAGGVTSRRKKTTPEDMMEVLMKSINERNEREERAIEQNRLLTEALLGMTSAIQKLGDKIDKINK